MPTPEEYAQLERDRAAFGGAPRAPTLMPGDDGGQSWGAAVADTVGAIPRGAAAAVMDVYGLADAVTGDALPDWNENPFGTSDNLAAGLVEGISNFAVGFIPVAGVLGKAGKLAKLRKAAGLFEEGAEAASFMRQAGKLTLKGDLLAGAVTDALVFNAHDGRLADIFKMSPTLQAATEDYIGWLQTHDDDGEAWGRVKNILEGAGVGGMVNAFQKALKLLVRGKKTKLTLEGEIPGEKPAAAEAPKPDELTPEHEELIEAVVAGKAAGDNRVVMQHPDGAKVLDDIRNGVNTNGGATFNVDGTNSDLFGQPLLAVTLASRTVSKSQLTVENVREFTNQFGEMLGDTDVKPGVYQMRESILEKTATGSKRKDIGPKIDPVTGEEQWSIDFNIIVKDSPEQHVRERVEQFLKENDQQAYFDYVKGDSVMPFPEASGQSPKRTPAEVAKMAERIRRETAPGAAQAKREPFGEPLSGTGPAPKMGDAAPEGARTILKDPVIAEGRYTGKLRNLGMDEDTIKAISDFIERGTWLRGKLNIPEGINPRNLSSLERAQLGLKFTDLNLSRSALRDGVDLQKRAIEELFRDAIEADIKTLTPKTMNEMAGEALESLTVMAGKSGDRSTLAQNMLVQMRQDERTLAGITARLNAAEFWLDKFGDEIFTKATKFQTAPHTVSAAEKATLIAEYQMFAEAVALVKGSKSERGRALRSLGQGGGFGRLISDASLVRDALDAAGGEAKVDAFIAKVAEAGKSDGTKAGRAAAVGRMNKVAEATLGRKTLNVVTEYWLNAILSGPQTSAVNILSGALFSVYRPIESAVGAQLARALSKDPALAAAYRRVSRDAAREVVALFTGVADAFRLSKDAFKTAESTLIPDQHTLDAVAAKDRGAIHSEMKNGVGAAINWLGSVVRLPTHVMAGSDEFFKQLTYRAYAQAHLTGQAIDAGKTGADVAKFVAEGMDELAYKGQAYSVDMLRRKARDLAAASGITDPPAVDKFVTDYTNANFRPEAQGAIAAAALKYAREVTLSTPLERGSYAATAQRAVQEHPILRFVLPFVRTPMNVIYSVGQRGDVGGGTQMVLDRFRKVAFPKSASTLEASRSRFVRDMISGDPRRVADAHGRLMMGVAVLGIGMSAAASGLITGRGPSDPRQRKALVDAGWLPYAIKTSNGYVSFARMDPFATALGLMADVYDVQRFSHDSDQTKAEGAINAVLVALANNFTNKSYLVGVANFVEMLQAPDRKVDGYTAKMIASFVPNLVKSTTTVAGDEHMHEARTVADAVMAKLPFLAQRVDPVRNILGEPVEKITAAGSDAVSGWLDATVPFSARQVAGDAVRNELADVVLSGGGALGPPSPERFGVDLREIKKADGRSAYDRYQALVGEVSISGRTLRQELTSLVKSSRYQSLPREVADEFGSPRAKEITAKVQEYRTEAWEKLKREFPELAARERMFLNQKRDLTSGGNALRNFVTRLNQGN